MTERPNGGRAKALAALVVCAALLLSSAAAAGRGEIGDKACLPVSVEMVAGTFTYTVRAEAGNVGCGLARSVLRDAAEWPPGESAATAPWRCTVGQNPTSWAISCTRGGAIVRAYGPVREQNPWVTAAVRLTMRVLAPTSTLGLVLREVRPRLHCDLTIKESLTADYARADGATLTIAEGKPYACGNLGIPPVLAVWHIHGRPAGLTEFCAPAGCARVWGDYALDWTEHGVGIVLMTHGLRQRELLAIARSMTVVPA